MLHGSTRGKGLVARYITLKILSSLSEAWKRRGFNTTSCPTVYHFIHKCSLANVCFSHFWLSDRGRVAGLTLLTSCRWGTFLGCLGEVKVPLSQVLHLAVGGTSSCREAQPVRDRSNSAQSLDSNMVPGGSPDYDICIAFGSNVDQRHLRRHCCQW